MSDKKPCVLEGAAPIASRDAAAAAAHAHHAPCALLSADPVPAPAAHSEGREVEDESADPVGDGHSDAEWAARHPEGGHGTPHR